MEEYIEIRDRISFYPSEGRIEEIPIKRDFSNSRPQDSETSQLVKSLEAKK